MTTEPVRRCTRRWRALLAIVAFGGLVACGGPAEPELRTTEFDSARRAADIPDCPIRDGEAVPEGLPAVTLECLGEGATTTLAGVRSAVVVLWAQWCSPCRAEMPLLAEALADEAVSVYLVNTSETRYDWAIDLAAETGMRYPVLVDEDARLATALGLQGLPMTIVVADDGEVAHIHKGQWRTTDEIEAVLDEAIG